MGKTARMRKPPRRARPLHATPQQARQHQRPPVVLAEFGSVLRSARGRMPESVAVRKVRAFLRDAVPFEQTSLRRYESGGTERPDALLLYALANVYGRDPSDLFDALKRDRTTALGAAEPIAIASEREGPMFMDGAERRLIRNFRSLGPEAQEHILRQIEVEIRAMTPTGAADAEARFREGEDEDRQ